MTLDIKHEGEKCVVTGSGNVPIDCCCPLRDTHHVLNVKVAFLTRHTCAVGDRVAIDGVGLLLGEAEGGLEGGEVAGGKHLRRGLEYRLG